MQLKNFGNHSKGTPLEGVVEKKMVSSSRCMIEMDDIHSYKPQQPQSMHDFDQEPMNNLVSSSISIIITSTIIIDTEFTNVNITIKLQNPFKSHLNDRHLPLSRLIGHNMNK